MKKTHKLMVCVLSLILLTACGSSWSSGEGDGHSSRYPDRKDGNGIYYWRTTFKLDSVEQQFLTQNDVKRMYVRFFDVVKSKYDNSGSTPNATITFKDTVPEGVEIVPTVYVLNNVLDIDKRAQSKYTGEPESELLAENIDLIAQKIVKRVMLMCKAHGINTVREVQVDCDWTKSTRNNFDQLCRRMQDALPDSIELSATIRLHQLRQSVPPVGRGVLMVYNTGNFRNINTKNSIIDLNNIKPYLRDVDYDLPLDVAYPAFEWSLLYNERNEFAGIMYNMDWSDKKLYKPIGPNLYEVISRHYRKSDEALLKPGYKIKVEQSSIEELKRVKQAIDAAVTSGSTILYHLDSKNLSKYAENEILEIYRNSTDVAVRY